MSATGVISDDLRMTAGNKFTGVHRTRVGVRGSFVQLKSGHRVRLLPHKAVNGRFEQGSDLFIFDACEAETWAGWGETFAVKFEDIEQECCSFFD